jgi:hypothetical protein
LAFGIRHGRMSLIFALSAKVEAAIAVRLAEEANKKKKKTKPSSSSSRDHARAG